MWLQEPVAFFGGMFAGLLRLDLNDEPLKEWVSKTVEASGISEEEIEARGLKAEEEAPQQIEIEWLLIFVLYTIYLPGWNYIIICIQITYRNYQMKDFRSL